MGNLSNQGGFKVTERYVTENNVSAVGISSFSNNEFQFQDNLKSTRYKSQGPVYSKEVEDL